jgi:hypothetical protein
MKASEMKKKPALVKSPKNKYAGEIATGLHLALVYLGLSDDYIETKPVETIVQDIHFRVHCSGRHLQFGRYDNEIPLMHTVKRFIMAYLDMKTDPDLLEHYTLLLCFRSIQLGGDLQILQTGLIQTMEKYEASSPSKNKVIKDTIESFTPLSRDDGDNNQKK